jgi:Ca-activated chloride channel family protein
MQSAQSDPVAGLIDFPLPKEVSLLPQTWESRVAIALLLATAIAAMWHLVHRRRANRYRREALAELDRLRRSGFAARPELLSRLTVLVRRTALAAFPREQVAPLVGPAWLSFLDRSYDGKEFSQGVGRLLASGPYQPIPLDEAELQSLVGLIRRWIKVHHV